MFPTAVTTLLAPLAIAASSSPLPPLVADTNCIVMNRLEGRRSPLDSLTFMVQGHPVKVCYGRPSARGRTMIGGASVPYGKLWRTGANEPTMIHTPVTLNVAGIDLEPGSYSLYTVPNTDEWQIVLNRSISQWGHERNYVDEVAAQEIRRASARSRAATEHVETFTIRAEPTPDGNATLVLEWEHTRVVVPVTAAP